MHSTEIFFFLVHTVRPNQFICIQMKLKYYIMECITSVKLLTLHKNYHNYDRKMI